MNRLAGFLEVAAEEQEMEGVIEYYLGMPLRIEVEKLEPGLASEVGRWSAGASLGGRCLNDIFLDANPPLGLLEAVRDFAKAHFVHPASLWGGEIALLIYYAAIATALVRHGARISRLSPVQMQQGFDWALGQPWVGQAVRETIGKAELVHSPQSTVHSPQSTVHSPQSTVHSPVVRSP